MVLEMKLCAVFFGVSCEKCLLVRGKQSIMHAFVYGVLWEDIAFK